MLFHPPILAANDAGALIWLIIIIFWAFSTVAQKIREKKEAERRRSLRPAGPYGAPPPPPPPPEPKEELDPEEELRRFLQEITGTAPAQPKPQPASPPPPPSPRPSPAYGRKRNVATPAPAPSIQFDEPPAAPVASQVTIQGLGAYANTSQEIGAANDEHIYEMLGEIEDIEVLMSRQAATLYSGETLIRQDSMLVNLSRIRVPLMTLPFVSYKSVRNAADRPQLIGNRNALSQALIARVVLGPCKAFDSAPGKDGLANQ